MSTPTHHPSAGKPGAFDRASEPVSGSPAKGTLASPPPVIEPAARARDGIILAMMLLVAVAVAGMLHFQAGFPAVVAISGGLAVLVISMAANVLTGRSSEVSRLHAEIARLEHEMARFKTAQATAPSRTGGPVPSNAFETEAGADAGPRAGAQTGAPVVAASAAAGGAPEGRWDPLAARRARLNPSGPANASGNASVHASANATASAAAANNAPAQAQGHAAASHGAPGHGAAGHGAAGHGASGQGRAAATPYGAGAPSKEQASAGRLVPAPVGAPQDASSMEAGNALPPGENGLSDWDITPGAESDALRASWDAAIAAGPEAGSRSQEVQQRTQTARMPPSKSIEADLELVQRKIKALADEVNANEAARAAPQAPPAARNSAPVQPAANAMDDSIAALRQTADRMRPGQKGFAGRPAGDVMPSLSQPPEQTAQAARQQQLPTMNVPAGGYPELPQPAATANAGPSLGQYQPAAAPGGFGTLPSLDALIPSTAQPIAVSGPVRRTEAEKTAPQAGFERVAPADLGDLVPPLAVKAPQPAFAPSPAPAAAAASERAPAPLPAPAQRPAPPSSPRQQQIARPRYDRRIAEIAAAIEQRRMDVYLNPIVGLGDYAVTHFEINVRLRAENGSYIDDAAETLRLDATDLVALFDIERLERTARVGEQLEARGKSGSLLSPTAGQSMTDGKFLEAFAQTFESRTSISGQLVLTFSQADVESFGPAIWQSLADMHSFGFRFAMERVSHLGMDFNALAGHGFAFVKLPAEAFLDGLPAGHGMVPPADICRHLSGAGLTLVVEAVDDDQLLARVFGFGALFGQGRLFGGSRQITLDALGPKRAA